jgi:hypothetical protein
MTFTTLVGQTAAIARATASGAAKSDLLQPLAQHMTTQRLVAASGARLTMIRQ